LTTAKKILEICDELVDAFFNAAHLKSTTGTARRRDYG